MDKQAVARSFSLAASHYDASAHLQRFVADALLRRVEQLPVPEGVDAIADLGTGTGYLLPHLQTRFQPKQLIGLDISAAMLRQASQRSPAMMPMCADLEAPAFADNSISLATSSLAVQWLDGPLPFLANAARWLRPGGFLALTTLGPRTLCELRHAWSLADDHKHVNDFHAAYDWLSAVDDVPLELVFWREQRIEVRYELALTLLHELKSLGASHVERREAPRRSHVRQMLKAYESFRRSDGRLPASWEVFTLIVKKPELL